MQCLKSLITAVALSFAIVGSALGADATSIEGTPIIAPPTGFPNPTYQGCPNCASLDGLVPMYKSSQNGYVITMPQIAGGPSALTANQALIGNQWNWLDDAPNHCTAPPLPPYCYFRGGMVAYPNGGYWNLRDGVATFAGQSGVEYDILIGPDPVTHQGGVPAGYVSNFYLEQERGL
jgi:hypothetical protein